MNPLIGVCIALCLLTGVSAQAASSPTTPDSIYTTTDMTVPVGDHVLSARLYRPAGKDRYPVVLLGAGSGNESVIGGAYTRHLAAAFASQGIGAFAYDKRGTGKSSGGFTGSDFDALGQDAAALVRHLRTQPEVEAVGIWGISQFGWIAPIVVKSCPDVCFAILVSPAGVNPHEQVSWFLHHQALGWGLSPGQAGDAERLHRAVSLYYAGRSSWRDAQAEVDRYSSAPWFQKVVTHPYWDEMPGGQVLAPDTLALALAKRPLDFEIYRSRSSFVDYRNDYKTLRALPTLIVYGGKDALVPIDRSRVEFEAVLGDQRQHPHEFRTFPDATHDIQTADGHVLAEYLTTIADWARAQFDARLAPRARP